MNHDSDNNTAGLVAAVREGRKDAFSARVDCYHGSIFRLCLGIAGNIPDAEDGFGDFEALASS